jgi:hypothetical protein
MLLLILSVRPGGTRVFALYEREKDKHMIEEYHAAAGEKAFAGRIYYL